MPLVPYDPLQVLRRDFGSMPGFSHLFGDGWVHNVFAAGTPRVEVRESATEVIVTAEIPGLEKKEDVHIVVHDNHLHLSGKINQVSEDHRDNIHRTERFYGEFSRIVNLPTSVEEEQAKATYRNGILEVHVPKTQKQIGRQVDIEFH